MIFGTADSTPYPLQDLPERGFNKDSILQGFTFDIRLRTSLSRPF